MIFIKCQILFLLRAERFNVQQVYVSNTYVLVRSCVLTEFRVVLKNEEERKEGMLFVLYVIPLGKGSNNDASVITQCVQTFYVAHISVSQFQLLRSRRLHACDLLYSRSVRKFI